ncbi:MAG TPA: SCO family protein [Chitinophagaceae bacterium]|nr:SCO family protein [Chitinophagaceae bacterium]
MKDKGFYAIIGVVVLVALAASGWFAYSGIAKKSEKLPMLGPPGHKVGNFTLVDQIGDTVTQKILNNKVSIVEYFYTSCTGICPRMNKNLSKVYQDLKDLKGFQIISNTVDPATDSVPVLAAYAKERNADPKNWKFLTGPKSQLFSTAIKGYLLNAADSIGVTGEYVHTQWFALVDQERRIRGFYNGLEKADMKKLKRDVKQLLAKEEE